MPSKRKFQPVTTDEPSCLLMIKSSDDPQSQSDVKFNPCSFTARVPNTDFVTSVSKIVPLYFSCDNRFDEIPDNGDLEKMDTIFVAFSGLLGGNMITGLEGKGRIYEVLCCAHREVRAKSYLFVEEPAEEGGVGVTDSITRWEPVVFENKNGIHAWDLDYRTPRDMSTMNVRLLDSSMKELKLPRDVNVTIVMKIFHAGYARLIVYLDSNQSVAMASKKKICQESCVTNDKHEEKKETTVKQEMKTKKKKSDVINKCQSDWHKHRRKFNHLSGLDRKKRNLWAKLSYKPDKQSINKIYNSVWKYVDQKRHSDKKDATRHKKQYLVRKVLAELWEEMPEEAGDYFKCDVEEEDSL